MTAYRITNLSLPNSPLFGAHILRNGRWLPATGPKGKARRWKSYQSAQQAMEKIMRANTQDADVETINQLVEAFVAGEAYDVTTAFDVLNEIDQRRPDLADLSDKATVALGDFLWVAEMDAA